jgi:hypothetical protein
MNASLIDKPTEYKVSLWISDEGSIRDLDHDAVTRALGMSPTKVVHKGEKLSSWSVCSRLNSWIMDAGIPPSTPLQEQMKAFRAILDPVKEPLRRISDIWSAIVLCEVRFKGYGEDMVIDKDTITWMADLGLTLDIDIYAE